MRLKSAQTRLVVIASGDSLALATELLNCTNVISPHGIFSASALSNWITTFYASIKTSTIAEACDLATAQSRVPMKLLTQQVPPIFSWFFKGRMPRGSGPAIRAAAR